MKDKEKKVQKKMHLKYDAPKSVPTSPAATASHHHRRESREVPPAPLDLTRVISGSQRKKLFSSSGSPGRTPPHTPTNLSVDTAVDTVRQKQQLKHQQILRTASGNGGGDFKKRSLTCDDTTLGLIPPPLSAVGSAGISGQPVEYASTFTPTGIFTPSLLAGTSSFFGGMHAHVSPRNSSASSHKMSAVIVSGTQGGSTSPGGISTTTATAAVQPAKSKFKMAHESFRIRMFQEQYGFEPVFMTKKRTADSKFSEFKGGDLNKYTAKSYTIKNGNEIFGGWFLYFVGFLGK